MSQRSWSPCCFPLFSYCGSLPRGCPLIGFWKRGHSFLAGTWTQEVKRENKEMKILEKWPSSPLWWLSGAKEEHEASDLKLNLIAHSGFIITHHNSMSEISYRCGVTAQHLVGMTMMTIILIGYSPSVMVPISVILVRYQTVMQVVSVWSSMLAPEFLSLIWSSTGCYEDLSCVPVYGRYLFPQFNSSALQINKNR